MENEKILSKINTPADLLPLSRKQLEQLCGEIRGEILDVVSKNGGHLSSNLGVVELTCCLERVFYEPENDIVFDVGHQCYTHKLLTGRKDRFSTLRQEGGISGFLRPDESPYDRVISGHSSTALSSVLGLAAAHRISGRKGQSVAVIGDGAMTAGLFFEALNNVASSKDKVVIVINDNELSISQNVGGLSRHMAVLTSRKSYFRFKDNLKKFLTAIPLIGNALLAAATGIRNYIKTILRRDNIFTDIGIKYLGPVDGHDIKQLLTVFERAKSLDKSVVVHCITVKGKGFTRAENDPTSFHSTAPFEISAAENGSGGKKTFSDAMGQILCGFAQRDGRVCAVTASMKEGTGLHEFSERFPERFFDVGIAEQHAVTFCAGLAVGGAVPFFAVYSTFLQRAYDQIIHDVAIQGNHVVFCVDRAGFVGSDGETHNGLFDVGFLNTVPGLTIYSPDTFAQLELCMEAALAADGPVAVRYPRGGETAAGNGSDSCTYTYLENGSDTLAVCYGRLSSNVYRAAESLKGEGADVAFLKFVKIKPICEDAVNIIMCYKKIVFFEEAAKPGSIGETLGELLAERGYCGKYSHYCAGNGIEQQAGIASLYEKYSFDVAKVREILYNNARSGATDHQA